MIPTPFCRPLDALPHIPPALLRHQRQTSIRRGDRGMLVAGVDRVARAYSIGESCSSIAYLSLRTALRPRRSTCGTLDKDFKNHDLTSRAPAEGVESGRQGRAAGTNGVYLHERTDHPGCTDTLWASVPDFSHSPRLVPRRVLHMLRHASGKPSRHRRHFRRVPQAHGAT